MITTIKDEDYIEHFEEYDAVLVDANIYNSMGEGLLAQVKHKYDYAYLDNSKTRYGDLNKLGTILECKREGKPTICLCYVVKYPNARPDLKKDCFEYDALTKCLKLVNVLYKGKRIAMPLFGRGYYSGNSDRDRVKQIIEECITDVDAVVYDSWQYSVYAEWLKVWRKMEKAETTEEKKEIFLKQRYKFKRQYDYTEFNESPFEAYSFCKHTKRPRCLSGNRKRDILKYS